MAVKPGILRWALDTFSADGEFLYLDSDVMAYSRFEELEFVLEQAEMVLTPHHVTDEASAEGTFENMLPTLLCGVFNSGFLAVRRSADAQAFLDWWSDKLREFCYRDQTCGLYFEQKWLDAALAYFDFTVFREPGYNVAHWNVASRRLTSSKRFGIRVNGRPLRFFHFSTIDSGRDLAYFKRQLPKDNAVFKLREEYLAQIAELNGASYSQGLWTFDFFDSGERILPAVRQAWRHVPELANNFACPFAQSNAIISRFVKVCRGVKSTPA